MKNKLFSYKIISSIGLILIISTMSSNIFWVRYIFGLFGVLLELVSLILLVKELYSKNKSSQESMQNEEVNINISSKRLRIDGGSTKVVAIIATICAIGLGIATAVTSSAWCGAAATTCALVAAWCGIAPSI